MPDTGGMVDSDFLGAQGISGPGLAGLMGGLGKMASSMQGGGGGQQQEEAPQGPKLPPPRIGAESAQQQAGIAAQAPQMMQGLLSPGGLLDPRKQRR
jgi:hypothetical protein